MHDFYGFDINLKFNVPNELEFMNYKPLCETVIFKQIYSNIKHLYQTYDKEIIH